MTLSAGLRVAWSYAVVILLLLVSWIVANFALHSADNSLRGIVGHEDVSSSQAMTIAAAMTDQQAGLRDFLITGDPRLLGPYRSGQRTITQEFRSALRAADGPIEVKRFQMMQRSSMEWERWSQSIIDRRNGLVSVPVGSLPNVRVGIRLLQRFQADTSRLLDKLQLDRSRQLAASRNTFNISDTVLTGTILIAILVVFVLAWQSVRLFAKEQRARRTAELAQTALHASAETFRLLFSRNPLPMWVYDLDTLMFLEVNAAAIAHYGYSREDFLGMRISDIRPEEDIPRLMDAVHFARITEMRQAGEWRHVLKNGETIAVELSSHSLEFHGRLACLVLAQDITEQKRTAEALAHQALHDVLTDLPNRVLLLERLEYALLVAERDGEPLALLLMDLDRFKEVNDTYGHHYGDLMLQQLAARLRGVLRTSDTIARLGGDEFAVLLPDTDERGAFRAGDKLLQALEQPFDLEGQQFDVSASIGIAMYPEHGTTSSGLLQRADVAMYVAKRGGDGCVLYTSEADNYSPNRLVLISQLRHAIDTGSLDLHYQPKMNLATGEIEAVESLVRWDHPERGFIPPDEFIPLAEHTGLIHALSLWVLNESIQQCRAWHDEGLDVRVGVNLSTRNLHDPKLASSIAELLQMWGVDPTSLEVELTESTVMDDPVRAIEVLSRLHDMGIRIAIDDFGTGYSSLAYLKRLPVDEIKIDKSFVLDMASEGGNRNIVRATIGLGHDLGMRMVAEGVETQSSLNLLSAFGCDSVQGYLLCRPLPADDFRAWLLERREKYAS